MPRGTERRLRAIRALLHIRLCVSSRRARQPPLRLAPLLLPLSHNAAVAMPVAATVAMLVAAACICEIGMVVVVVVPSLPVAEDATPVRIDDLLRLLHRVPFRPCTRQPRRLARVDECLPGDVVRR